MAVVTLDETTIDRTLFRCCHSFSGARERWAERREGGLSDDELVEVLRYEFGYGMGGFGPNEPAYECNGGANLWFSISTEPGSQDRQVFRGKRLLGMVRKVLCIGLPAPKGQIRLFEL